jgi:hypothetical protein
MDFDEGARRTLAMKNHPATPLMKPRIDVGIGNTPLKPIRVPESVYRMVVRLIGNARRKAGSPV